MIRIVVADDHAIVRHGLRALLEQEPDIHVVGETGDGQKTVEMVEQLTPDILIMDVVMPGLNGVEVAGRLSQMSDRTRIIILSMHANETYLLSALRSDVYGYVLKSEPLTAIVHAVREVSVGRKYLSPSLAQRAIDAYVNIRSGSGSVKEKFARLTPREREVVRLVVEGYTNTSIASRMSISQRTVETHRANLMRKLGLACQADLVRCAIESGIID